MGKFIKSLENEFQLGFVSLNYDDIMTQIIPDLATGFDTATGKFEPAKVYNQKKWHFIYHLHGSIHFDMKGHDRDMHGIVWNQSRDNVDYSTNATGRNTYETTEGLHMPMSTIVAGYEKTDQILRHPFRIYYSRLDQLIQEANAYLFLGYGFGDIHVNGAFYGLRKNAHAKPVVVIGWADDHEDPLPHRHDNWALNLTKTLSINPMQMSGQKYLNIPADIKELKNNNEFEISNDPSTPLAIWYGGMLNAADNFTKISKLLSR